MPKISSRLISLDCETTGLDWAHGARPFFVTICYEDGTQKFWEWDVDPLTREVTIPEGDKEEVRREIERADRIVGQNLKFDSAMLRVSGVVKEWPWGKTDDTLIAGHLLKTNQKHDLTTMSLIYLGTNIEPFEEEIDKAAKKARSIIQQAKLKLKRGREDVSDLASWRIAKEDLEDMPSIGGNKGKPYKADMWLPRAMAKHLNYLVPKESCDHRWGSDNICSECKGHKWWIVLRLYANTDSAVTLVLWEKMEIQIKQESLEEVYREKMKVPRVISEMESCGVTVLHRSLVDLRKEYKREADESEDICVSIAAEMGYSLSLPKSGNNKSLGTFAFDILELPVVKLTESGKGPAMDKDVMDQWPLMLEKGSNQLRFVQALKGKRKRDTSLAFLDAYEKFWTPTEEKGYKRLYASVNQTATKTLRFSMNNPNLQQVSKQESKCPECRGEGCDDCGGTGEDLHSVRKVFGPAPGREMWCFDYENIELRIPAYESDERTMIELFENADSPPYFGSYHLLNASIVYPDIFWPLAEIKGAFKAKYEADWYQYCKNGGFAIQYGCQEAKADSTFRKKGAYRTIKEKMPKVAQLNDHYVRMANRMGYVETIPDKSIGAKRGHPIYTESGWGRVSPTIPFNYHVQSTAMWCTSKAMVRCSEYLKEINRETGLDYKMVLQVHDEIVFDFPARRRKNLPKVRRIQKLMEMSGVDIGIPLKVAASYHPNNWSEKVKC